MHNSKTSLPVCVPAHTDSQHTQPQSERPKQLIKSRLMPYKKSIFLRAATPSTSTSSTTKHRTLGIEGGGLE